MPDEHLPVALGAGADPDRRDGERRGDPRGDRRRHRLEHDREAAGRLERERVVVEPERRVGRAALGAEAAELRRRLRRQADVAHHADVRVRDRADARDHPAGALELDDVGAALLHHPDRARDRLLVGDLVRAERQVADHERPARRARDRAREEDHLVERHRARSTRGRASPSRPCRRRGSARRPPRPRAARPGASYAVTITILSCRRFISASSGSASFPGAGVEGAGVRGRVLTPRGGRCRSGAPGRRARRSRGWGRRGRRRRRTPGSIPAAARTARARSGSRVASARGIASARARSAGPRRAFRDESASPSASRTVVTTRISSPRFEVADELLHDRDLLGVLAAEERELRPDEVEELQADGRDAAEVAGPGVALEPHGGAGRLDPRREPRRVHLLGRRREDDVDAVLGGERRVALEVARVRVEIGRLRELRRVDEDARDDEVALGAGGAEERGVPLVERAHRRHEADRRPRAGGRAQRRNRRAIVSISSLQFRRGYRAPAAYRPGAVRPPAQDARITFPGRPGLW